MGRKYNIETRVVRLPSGRQELQVWYFDAEHEPGHSDRAPTNCTIVMTFRADDELEFLAPMFMEQT